MISEQAILHALFMHASHYLPVHVNRVSYKRRLKLNQFILSSMCLLVIQSTTVTIWTSIIRTSQLSENYSLGEIFLDEVMQLRFSNDISKFTVHAQYAATLEVEITDWWENLNVVSHAGKKCHILSYSFWPVFHLRSKVRVYNRW